MKMTKINCWEYFKCGREYGGINTKELGVCPASISRLNSGINNGISAGRSCWTIKGTLCNQNRQGNFEDKLLGCINCSFFKLVDQEESREFVLISNEIINQ